MWDPVAIGRRGGLSKSTRKVEAARRNAKLGGAKGGRPPKLPPKPEGLRDSWNHPRNSPEHALNKFREYYAEFVVKKNAAAEQLGWQEQELWEILEQMGRRDLLNRRKKWWRSIPTSTKKKWAFLYRFAMRDFRQET